MTDLPPEEDLNLFRLFAAHETRQIMETLLEGNLQQKDIANALGMTPQAVSPAIKRLEVAGVVVRASARGPVSLTHHEATAQLLEMEARLVAEIQEKRVQRSTNRLRELRKRAMKGRGSRRIASDESA